MKTEQQTASRAEATNAKRVHPGLIALALGGFGIGLTEFVIAGLLTNVATDLSVSIPMAGHLVSVYALAVVVGALIVTLTLVRQPPKRSLVILMILFVIGNTCSAWSPNYAVMMVGRIIAALCHGGFFGVGSVVAADLVAPEKKAQAISIMFGGLTLANVIGVPFGTFLGQIAGWRATFAVISVVGVVTLVGIAFLVPRLPAEEEEDSTAKQLRALRRPQVLLSCAITILVFGGMFGAFMYIEPLLINVTHLSPGVIPWLLVGFGLGLCVGNFVGGKAADKALNRTIVTLSIMLPIVLAALALLAGSGIGVTVVLVLMGMVGFATVPALQLRVLSHAEEAPTMASAANIAAFNFGNAIGVFLGGQTLGAGLGYTSPALVGVALTATGLIVVLIATKLDRPNHVAQAAARV